MTALAWGSKPLFALDRRLPWNTKKREHGRLNSAHDGGPFDMSNDSDKALDGLPLVSFFKLVGLVAASVTPFLVAFMLFNAARTDQRVAAAVDTVLKEADARYVRTQMYEVRHAQLTETVNEMKLQVEAARIQRAELDRRLLENKMMIESLRNGQRFGRQDQSR